MKIGLRVPVQVLTKNLRQECEVVVGLVTGGYILKDTDTTYFLPQWVKGDTRQTEYNLIEASKKKDFPIIGMWEGFKRDLLFLEQNCSLVALPWYKPRTIYFQTPQESLEYIYWGFRSLDELRRFPPRMLITDMPVRAAVNGIDLTTRERRPKLDPLLEDLTLSKEQEEQVIKNILILRKAAKGMV